MGAVHAALEMHVSMLKNVFRWKMGRFDTTPLGRILNRFSKDVDVVDNTLPQVLRSWIMMFFGVILKTPSSILALFLLALTYLKS